MANPIPDAGALIRPKDKELVNLLAEIILTDYEDPRIPVININAHEPWELPSKSICLMHFFLISTILMIYYACAGLSGVVNSNDREWYFLRPSQKRNRRTTAAGYWKTSGYGSRIKERGEEIGTKTILVYHTGRTPTGVRTRWVIHEYNATCLPDVLRSFILCKVMDKSDGGGNSPNYIEGETGSDSNLMTDNSAYQATVNGTPQQEVELPQFPDSLDDLNELISQSDWLVFYDIFGDNAY
ncbi:NAC domain-containing protein 69 isoform X1 [Manihot esculenta]|uniref:Uncharacterized protein n=1 Tax=Manihot esculenta TaxID=3983 RepID=A0ACB7H8J5_MANES|nr:NAC domain-containing protein 69 isoform X1 [Manihot esculenta]KAG8649069.1 hypothetical protein MANES_08G065000v8 [Manihot esculenta]